jgi:hypothetical protein
MSQLRVEPRFISKLVQWASRARLNLFPALVLVIERQNKLKVLTSLLKYVLNLLYYKKC